MRGVDSAGNVGTGKACVVVVDGTSPSVSKMSISPSTSAAAYSASVPKLSYTVSDSNFKDVEYSVDGSDFKSIENNESIPASLFTGAKLYSIRIKVTDMAGNGSKTDDIYKTYQYYYDKTSPTGLTANTVSLNGDASATVYGSSGSIPVQWGGISDTLLKDVEYSIKDSDGLVVVPYSSSTVLGTAATGTGTATMPELPDGSYGVSIRAVDTAGNCSQEVSKTYVYDTTAPEIEGGGAEYNDDGTVTVLLNGVSEPNSDTGSFYYAISAGEGIPDQSAYKKATATSIGGQRYSMKIPVSDYLATGGMYHAYVAMKDKAGNTNMDSPASFNWYNRAGTVFDGSLTLGGAQAAGSDGNLTDSWKLSWDVANEDGSEGSLTSADVYVSYDNGNFSKIGTSTDGSYTVENLSELRFKTAVYRIVGTYMDGSRKLSDVYGVTCSSEDDYDADLNDDMGAA